MLRSVGYVAEFVVAGYSRSLGRTAVSFGPTDLVCCRTLQGHTGKVNLECLVLTASITDSLSLCLFM